MFPVARRAVTRHCIWRTYATEPTHESEPQSSRSRHRTSSRGDNDQRARIPRASLAQRSIYVRAWEHPSSMAEAFAIVRRIERKYGRIRDFKWTRDWEMPQSYQSILWASFYSPESFDQVPKAGETLHVEAPAVDSTKEGGVGFDDLQDLLKSSDRVDNEPESPGIMQRVIDSGDPTKPPSRRMLDIRVERALHDTVFYPDLEIPEYTHKKMLALNHALLDWGGFATLKPMFGSTSPYNVNQEDVPVESESMRKVMNLAARITGRPDPSFETAKVEKTVDAVEVIKEEVVKEEVVNDDPGPTREHSRSWSLPSPSQGSPSPTPPSERTRTTRPVAVKAQAGAGTAAAGKKRKQQILGKIKQPASEKTKGTGGKNNSTRGGETQKQEWSTSKKESKNRLESAKPAAGLKNRIWDVVGKWF